MTAADRKDEDMPKSTIEAPDLSDGLYCEHDRIGVQCEQCHAKAAGREFHTNDVGTVRAVVEDEPPTVA